MKASEAIEIAERAQAELGIYQEHTKVCELIKQEAAKARFSVEVKSLHPAVGELLESDGFSVTVIDGLVNDSAVIVSWRKKAEPQKQEPTPEPIAEPVPVVEVKSEPAPPAIIAPEQPKPAVIPQKLIAFLGNFSVNYTSETHHAASLKALGHKVFQLQEGKQTSDQIRSMAKSCDALVWVHTHGWKTPGSKSMRDVLAELKALGKPTISYHLDLWKGLKREADMQKDDVWDIGHFFTVDKLMADWFNEQKARGGKTTGHYLPAGVYHAECQLQPRTSWENDVVFVGARGYHSEWPYRVTLLDWLTGNYKERFKHYGDSPLGGLRGQPLDDLYANTKIVIGDTLCIDYKYPYYWSDRVYETIGRGGFIIHPYIKGMEQHFEDKRHLVFYEYGNFGQLKELIDYYLTHDDEREAIRKAGHEHVKANHTYLNRWQSIMQTLFAPKVEPAKVTDGVLENSAVS